MQLDNHYKHFSSKTCKKLILNLFENICNMTFKKMYDLYILVAVKKNY